MWPIQTWMTVQRGEEAGGHLNRLKDAEKAVILSTDTNYFLPAFHNCSNTCIIFEDLKTIPL